MAEDVNKTMMRVLLLGCGSICVFVTAVVTVMFVLAKRGWKRFNTAKKELLDLLNDESRTITMKNMQDMVAKVAKLIPKDDVDTKEHNDQPEIDVYVASIPEPWESQASAQGKLESVVGARDGGKLPILKESRATLASRMANLHVNKFDDLYGNPLYLSAAPLPAQFTDHWELIWQEKIGVIVWAGRLATVDGVRMDAYIPMEKGKEVTYGSFKIQTTASFDRHLKLAFYELAVTHEGSKRQILLVHAYEWLESSVTWALRREVEVIVQIKDAHIKQILAGRPGVMFQCKWGTAGSATLAAVYIGFQTWLKRSKVNVDGIVKYIRRYRWKAFEETGESSYTFLVQLKVVYTVMYALATFIETRKLAQFDEWLKGILAPRRR